MLRQRAIILLGLIPALIATLLGVSNTQGWTNYSPEVITGISASLGVIATFGVAILRSARGEIVFVVLAGIATATQAAVSIVVLTGLVTMSEATAGSIVTVTAALAAVAIAVLRGEVTSPAHVDELRSALELERAVNQHPAGG